MADSVFRQVIGFFGEIGIYDVILPYLLVFTIVFGIMEKTKILGTVEIGGKTYTKKSLNSMVAFVCAFLVVASSRLVSLINEAVANTVIFLILSVGFLMLIGTFYSEDEDVFTALGKARWVFAGVLGAAIILVFLHAIKTDSGESFLEWFWDYMKGNWHMEWVASLILLVFIIAMMFYITADKKEPKSSDGE
ncbi:hypothetical protein K9M79_08690 [Candidatus Woesearchaeota archaeon]|nr:hypothetical protein [Candidatus Woesearchaeota archaeon]